MLLYLNDRDSHSFISDRYYKVMECDVKDKRNHYNTFKTKSKLKTSKKLYSTVTADDSFTGIS